LVEEQAGAEEGLGGQSFFSQVRLGLPTALSHPIGHLVDGVGKFVGLVYLAVTAQTEEETMAGMVEITGILKAVSVAVVGWAVVVVEALAGFSRGK
jgi:hypothetical protein